VNVLQVGGTLAELNKSVWQQRVEGSLIVIE